MFEIPTRVKFVEPKNLAFLSTVKPPRK
jgi:hypothetical protein